MSVSLVIDGRTLHGHAAGPTYQAGLDTVIDRIERQAIDMREKPRSRTRPGAVRALRRVAARRAGRGWQDGARADGRVGEERARSSRIVKTKRFAIEPMFEEDALARMEELGHLFFIFVNAENERLCVLYRRRAGDYGLIEPMIGGEYTAGRSSRKG